MTLRGWLQPSCFSLADLTVLTTSNLLATDATAASAVTPGTGGSVKASTANLWSSAVAVMRQISGTTALQTRFPFAANTKAAVSYYRYCSAIVASSVLWGVRDGSGNLLFRAGLDGTGHLVIQTSGGTTVATSTATLTEARWNRYEWVLDIGSSSTTGNCTVNIYTGNNTGTPDVTVTATNKNLGGTGSNTAAIFDHGFLTASSGSQQDVAFLRTNDGGTTEIGPFLNTFSRPIGDTATGTDALTRLLVASRSLSDNAAGTDALTRSSSRTRTLSDTAAGTDALGRSLSLPRSLSDTAAATDALVRSTTRSRSLSDTAAGTDALVRSLALPRALSDTAAGTDAVVGTTPGGGRSISDTAAATDAVTRSLADSRALSDTAAGTDALTRSTSRSRALSDSAPAVDALTRTKAASRTLSDTAAGTDAVTRAVLTARPVNDTTSLSDLASRALTYARAVLDQAPATDTISAASIVVSATALERIFAVPRQGRSLAVEAELRTYDVPRQGRALQVEAEARVLSIRKELANV